MRTKNRLGNRQLIGRIEFRIGVSDERSIKNSVRRVEMEKREELKTRYKKKKETLNLRKSKHQADIRARASH